MAGCGKTRLVSRPSDSATTHSRSDPSPATVADVAARISSLATQIKGAAGGDGRNCEIAAILGTARRRRATVWTETEIAPALVLARLPVRDSKWECGIESR